MAKLGGMKKWKIASASAFALVATSALGGWMLFAPANPASAGIVALPEGPLAAQRVVEPDVKASDWQIVSVFEDEAIVATGRALVRVKVGSSLSGVGTITAIEADASTGGGLVAGTQATLRSH